MTEQEFAFIATLLKERSGLTLGKDKTYLLDTRLLPVARRQGLASVQLLIGAMQTGRSESLIDAVVEAMTTNETLFFRDRHPFDALRRHILPALIEQRAAQRALRIWSAACSTGQEPYSIAMILRDSFPELAAWHIEIIATDLAPAVLARAREGMYTSFEAQRGLPIHLLVKHFDQIGDRWQIKHELRRMITFQAFNLLTDPSPLGVFDVIFCRNVLIYFDQPTKAAVLDRLSRRLTPSGALILGGAESVFGISNAFAGVDNLRGVYRPTQGGKAQPAIRTAMQATARTPAPVRAAGNI